MWDRILKSKDKTGRQEAKQKQKAMRRLFFLLFFLMFSKLLLMNIDCIIFLFGVFLFFSRQGFSVALGPVLELALVDQAGLELTEIHLALPSECWD